MQDLQPLNPARTSYEDGTGVTFFASQVVSLLADRNARSPIEPRETLVSGLIAASLSGSKSALAELLVDMKRARVSVAALADVYIPIAARRIGEAWLNDEMSWIDVSISSGRLQALLREIGAAWVADEAGFANRGTVLMIVPEGEQHTLGPMVATEQMRRLGISVCLRLGPTAGELSNLLATRQFDGVMISVAAKERLDSTAKLVRLVKSLMSRPTPVVFGGSIISRMKEAGAFVGADFASDDVGAALEFVGLNVDAVAVLKQA